HGRLLRALRRGARLPRRGGRRGAPHRVHRDDHGPAALPARPHERQPPAPRHGRADGAQRADPGQRRRHHQGRDGRGRAGPPRRRPQLAPAAPGPRRARPRGRAGGVGDRRGARPGADGRRRRAPGPPRRLRRPRPLLARGRPLRAGGDRDDTGMSGVGFWEVDAAAAARANGRWWSENAAEYLDEHGAFLGDADFRWCPEGLREEEAGLRGDVSGLRVLEVGAGAAQCSRWLAGRGAEVLATDIAPGMVAASAELDRRTGSRVPAVVADARALPLADASVDLAFTSFGAIAFVPDAARIHAEVARVLRPGGRWVFAVVHPVRWVFPDDPTSGG